MNSRISKLSNRLADLQIRSRTLYKGQKQQTYKELKEIFRNNLKDEVFVETVCSVLDKRVKNNKFVEENTNLEELVYELNILKEELEKERNDVNA